jgi:hypothetical protein
MLELVLEAKRIKSQQAQSTHITIALQLVVQPVHILRGAAVVAMGINGCAHTNFSK